MAIDHLVLTAANAAQARGYTAQLEDRQASGLLNGIGAWSVLADPADRRVGSGGSTLWVLYQLLRGWHAEASGGDGDAATTFAEAFGGKRVVIVHSGGDSRRLVSYAAQGKVFTPLPCDVPGTGEPAALLDLILHQLDRLPAPSAGQVLIASGDVLLTFDPASVDFEHEGVCGVAYPGPASRGSKHGVYVLDGRGRVADFLQKPDEARARAAGAVDAVGRVLVDTGLVSLSPEAAGTLAAFAGVVPAKSKRARPTLGPGLLRDLQRGASPAVDLYEQMLGAAPRKVTRKRYLDTMTRGHTGATAEDETHVERLTALHEVMQSLPLRVSVLPWCDFFHIGTHRELLANIDTLGRTAQRFGFVNGHLAAAPAGSATGEAFVHHSRLGSDRVKLAPGSLIEGCDTDAAIDLGGPSLLVGLPPGLRRSAVVQLPEGWLMVATPVAPPERGAAPQEAKGNASGGGGGEASGGWAVVVAGLDDDFKTSVVDGGTFGNRPMAGLAERLGVDGEQLELADGATLWDLPLWRVGTLAEALAAGRWLIQRVAGEGPDAAAAPQRRLPGQRVSMRALLPRVDHERLVHGRRELVRRVRLAQLEQELAGDPWLPAERVRDWAATRAERADATQRAAAMADAADRNGHPLEAARLHQLTSVLASKRGEAADRQAKAYASVAASVARPTPHGSDDQSTAGPAKAAVLPDQVVWSASPVRIDFAGGWSDTPPICNELGGAVVNAAVKLNGQHPVQCVAKLTDRPVISMYSIDLGQRVVFERLEQLRGEIDARHWTALPLAALRLSGLIQLTGGRALGKQLERFGGGVDLTMFSALPKGSGMGTSSVLGATLLACLGRIAGRGESRDGLIARTSLLEQAMGTAGGWQDQVGGLTGGIKLIRTDAGADQTPTLHWIALELGRRPQLAGRCLLYFTGIQRMARDILQKVVARYLRRDPELVRIVHRLKDNAEGMKRDLDAGDLDAFARRVDRYWDQKRAIDPGSTNPQIEALLEGLQGRLEARLLPGAGGGGFVFMIAKSLDDARAIRQQLTDRPPNPLARFFEWEIDPAGLSVTVL